MEKTLVVGGSGFIGSAIQRAVLEEHLANQFAFSFSSKPEKIHRNLNKIRLNMLEAETDDTLGSYPAAIYVAGSADHGLAKRSPLLDLDLNVRSFLRFSEKFKGSLVILSSQAVYFGLEGEIPETVNHLPTIPYGLSKKMVEEYAKYFQGKNDFPKLWIFRLAYAFGKGEKEQRLIPRCANAAKQNNNVTLFGDGKSFVNPLPVEFVAKTLLKASQTLVKEKDPTAEITNLNYPEKTTVKDVAEYLRSIKQFDLKLTSSGEEWPVKFWGNTDNLSIHLKEWGMNFPDLWVSLKTYFTELT